MFALLLFPSLSLLYGIRFFASSAWIYSGLFSSFVLLKKNSLQMWMLKGFQPDCMKLSLRYLPRLFSSCGWCPLGGGGVIAKDVKGSFVCLFLAVCPVCLFQIFTPLF